MMMSSSCCERDTMQQHQDGYTCLPGAGTACIAALKGPLSSSSCCCSQCDRWNTPGACILCHHFCRLMHSVMRPACQLLVPLEDTFMLLQMQSQGLYCDREDYNTNLTRSAVTLCWLETDSPSCVCRWLARWPHTGSLTGGFYSASCGT